MAKIICTKNILGGKKRISGTRISFDIVYNYIIDDNIDQIYKDYPHLKREQVRTALNYFDEKIRYAKERVDYLPA
ncbi:MAG: DUF433 domain-containing protein [Patescibacteria group bacterium]|nr:DUF433 domain-containing protein [Patescibacteria group bacterium]